MRIQHTGATQQAGALGGLSGAEAAQLLGMVRNAQSPGLDAMALAMGLSPNSFGGRIDNEISRLGRNNNTYTPGPGLGAISGNTTLHIGHRGQGVADLQRMLNSMGANLQVDGKLGPKTEAALKAFQQSRGLGSSGVLDARSLGALRAGGARIPQASIDKFTPKEKPLPSLEGLNLPPPEHKAGDMSPQQLQSIVGGKLSDERAARLAPHLNQAMRDAGITTTREKAAFVAQLSHESAGFKHFEELASGRAYEGRRDLGNTQPGDGQRYKGRGPIQLTGRANYTKASRDLGIDLVNNPELAATPEVGFKVAAWYWKDRNIGQLAQSGDFQGVTKRINGGLNGYADRVNYYQRALQTLT